MDTGCCLATSRDANRYNWPARLKGGLRQLMKVIIYAIQS